MRNCPRSSAADSDLHITDGTSVQAGACRIEICGWAKDLEAHFPVWVDVYVYVYVATYLRTLISRYLSKVGVSSGFPDHAPSFPPPHH